jgi:hypothetical protein
MNPKIAYVTEYNAWHNLNRRCKSRRCPEWKYYGGRGIKNRYVSFWHFLADVGLKPRPTLTLDRIDNNGHYETGNCRWATYKQQMNNKRHRKSKFKNRAEMLHAYYLQHREKILKKKLDK